MSEIGYNGRDAKIKIGGTAIAAVQSKTATHAREGIDVTTDDSDGYRILLPSAGMRYIDIAVEGVATEDNLPQLQGLWTGGALSTVTFEYADGSVATAENGFFFSAFEVTASYDGAITFSATFQSSGEVTITPAPGP